MIHSLFQCFNNFFFWWKINFHPSQVCHYVLRGRKGKHFNENSFVTSRSSIERVECVPLWTAESKLKFKVCKSSGHWNVTAGNLHKFDQLRDASSLLENRSFTTRNVWNWRFDLINISVFLTFCLRSNHLVIHRIIFTDHLHRRIHKF